MTAGTLASLVGYVALGAAMAAVYLCLLRVNTRLYLEGGPWWKPILLHLGRVAVMIAGFWGAATGGAGAVLAAFGGFLLARAALIRPMARFHG
jgi:hypothetical protein